MNATEISSPLAEALMNVGNTMTIIRARGRRLAKVIHKDGTIDAYDKARTFDLAAVPVPDLAGIERVLRQLVLRSDCAVVRGTILDMTRVRGVRRLLHPDPTTGDVPTLCDVPKRWAAFDVDDLPRPPDVEVTDLFGCARVAIRALPKAFCDSRCVAQATASHGIAPGINIRLWCRFDRPISSAELRRWLRAAPVDHAVFRPAQVIYTAPPLFDAGVSDPLAERLIMMAGRLDEVQVPSESALAPPARKTAIRGPAIGAAGESRYGSAALISATARVARAGQGARHPTLLAEAMGLARLVARGLLSENTVIRALGGAAEMVGLPEVEAANAITWALAHPGSDRPGTAR